MDVNKKIADGDLLLPRSASAQAEGVREPFDAVQGARRSHHRLAIVNRLASRGDTCACEFDSLGLSQPTISHHLKVLREVGLIEIAHERGTYFFYRLVPEAVEALAFALGGSPQPELVLATAEGTVAR